MTNNSDSNISENNLNQDENHREESSLMIINDNKSQKSNKNNYETVTVVKESDVEFVEQRFESVSSPLKLDISNESSASTESTGSNIDEFIMKMNDTQLRQELNRFGFEIVGPLNSHTRHCYQRKFHTLRKENEQQTQQNQQKQPQRQKQTEQDGEIQAKMANYHIEELLEIASKNNYVFIRTNIYKY